MDRDWPPIHRQRERRAARRSEPIGSGQSGAEASPDPSTGSVNGSAGAHPSEESKSNYVLTAFLLSFAVIFVAELGDKSQLMALAFATRYPAVPVLIGITLATALVHAVSVVVGAALGAAMPTDAINFVAALSFVAFGLWTLRGDRLTEEEEQRAARPARNVVLAVGGVFFLAELGDKTMLATITLATTEGLFGTWLGSTLGMVAADALAILVGRQLGARLPERAIRIGAAITFFVFAAVLFVEAF